MTNAMVAKELRKIATGDDNPWCCDPDAFGVALRMLLKGEHFIHMDFDGMRTFFLLVAEAIESEGAK